ncbi:MAG: hypothetical protein KDD14_24370, partial [Saprospiraceae bacterium]|nr:hypothetical protein [Saprospiraceae bacterium]
MKSYFYTATSIQLFNASLKKGAFSGVRASCFFVLMLLGGTVWGQTNPAAQALPYTQNFSGLLASSTTYPTGWQGWQLGTGASGVFRTNAPTGDLALNGNSTASTTAGGVHNYNGKIGILQSGSNDPSLAFAINTTSLSNVRVTYDVMTIRNPYDGNSNTRINEVTLQYRVGTSGTFTTLTGIEYQNNTTTQTGSVTTPQNLQNRSIILPPACDNQAIVQLRWAARDVSGAGSRASFAFDNISVCQAPTANAGADLTTCVDGIVYVAGTVGGSATGGTWTSNTPGGLFLPNANTLAVFYIPPPGNVNPITLTLTSTGGACPPDATDDVVITYGVLPPLTLSATGPSSANCGDEVTISIAAVNGFIDIKSYQFIVKWDPAKFDYVTHSSTVIGGVAGTVGTFDTPIGELTYGWVDPAGIPGENLTNGTEVLTVTLKVLASTGLDEPVDIIGTIITPLEATNSQQCFLTVIPQNNVEIDFNPVPVTCPTNQMVCSSDAPFALTATPSGGTYSGSPGVNGAMFDPAMGNLGVNTITYMYTHPVTGCSNSCTFDINVTSTVTPSVSISANPGNNICAGTSVTFTAVPTNGGASPTYQWKLNGGNVGSNSNMYTNAALANGDQVSCEMTSNAPCAMPATATSNTVTMTVTANVTPSVSISANPGNNICAGTSVTFTAVPTNGGAS